MSSLLPLFSQCDPAGRRPAESSIEELHRNKPSLRGAHNSLRIAPEEESDRTAVRALGAGVQNSAVFCARSVRTAVRSRRRCPADTFGATFWCQKVVNLLLAGKTESKVRGYFPKNRSGNFSLFKILFLVLLVRSKWGKCLLLHSAYSYLWLTP